MPIKGEKLYGEAVRSAGYCPRNVSDEKGGAVLNGRGRSNIQRTPRLRGHA